MYLSVATYPTRRTPPPNPFSRGLHRPFSSLFSLFFLFPPSLSPVEPSSRGARKLERVGNNGRKEEKGHGKRNISRNVLPWSPFQLPSTLSHPRVTSFEPPFEGPSRRPRPTNHPPFAHSALHVFAGGWREGGESVEEASFLTGCTRRKGSREGRSVKGEWREARGWEAEEAERERNDNPFDGHNAARHRKAHQTRNTANRPPLVSFSSLASPRLVPPSLHLSPQPSPSPSKTSKRPTYPRLYANHHRHRPPGPVINLLNYITRTRFCPSLAHPSSYKSTIFPLPYNHPPLVQLAGIFVSLFSLPSSKLVRASPFFRNRGKGKILLFYYSRVYFKGAGIFSNREKNFKRIR